MGNGLWFIVHEFLLLMGYLFFGAMGDEAKLKIEAVMLSGEKHLLNVIHISE